ncbi:J domain-containing protein [Hymenobacter sp. BT683]|uniref:J domain-containing protein n=1 Tax=Hymenobacter jeongseonensis TaxID=2791027 RepID=A0ABS0IET9_9BACT|nr:J domain-containing protein [Hymenobacter jeongseonensis]MBF9236360.1 J domain-containing protein [Hymenobacter jeongseonensis]
MKHYEALELTNTASAADIRSAYRRLVLLTHPDRTSDPAAHARYLDVNAAYEVLSDPTRRAAYDDLGHFTASTLATSTPAPNAGDRRRRSASSTRHHPRGKTEAYPHEAAYLRYAPLGKAICKALLVFSLLLGIDRVWVLNYPREEVQSCTLHSSKKGGSYCVIRTQNSTFRGPCMNAGEVLDMRRTALFGQVLAYKVIETRQYGLPSRYWDENFIYAGAGLIFVVAMVLTASVGAWPGPAGKRQVECAATAAILAIIVLWFLATS